jgi:1,4-dihydroxy-2-naphthoyl-CoA hydrolase
MADPESPEPAFDPRSGWAGAMGLEFPTVSMGEVVAEWVVGPEHRQPHGIVHGGVFCGVVETVCSIGAALHAARQGQLVVGVENHTSFIRAVREGRLRCVGKPLQAGRRAHLWEANVFDAEGRLVATGRVRLFCLAPGETTGRG